MSEAIKHECGIGVIRLLKPLSYYQEKYGSALWGLNKMYLLMEKQRNRGQDGAGLASVKLQMPPGKPYMERIRDNTSSPWTNIFHKLDKKRLEIKKAFPDNFEDARILKQHFDFAGEVLLGHLRYGTHGSYGINACHPVSRVSQYQNRSLALAGNFNLTNVDYLFQKLVELGQHPRHETDTETVLERICHFLDNENEQLYRKYKKEGYTRNEIAHLISDDLNVSRILKHAAKVWDGGYVIGGIIGNGDAFLLRDPNGIRPCYYYHNDEFAVAASERSAICTVFNLRPNDIAELQPGHALVIKADGKITEKSAVKAGEKRSCSFERIYFSRGNDVKIYQERKALGKHLVPKVLENIDYDLDNTIFGYIPNTAESAFWGLIEELGIYQNAEKVRQIMALGPDATPEVLQRIINTRPRMEKIILKDVKMRTFIADDSSRDDLVAHVYDITRGIVRNHQDTLVLIDDSIVRGTTIKKSILQILARLVPKKIVIVSSAPQIRYPDCYGIDMSQIEKLVAFQAAIELLRQHGKEKVIEDVYQEILTMRKEMRMEESNAVMKIYEPFTEDEISAQITRIVSPKDFPYDFDVIFQPLENLVKAIPNHRGDWYFSGDYPTPGGNRVVNQAFLNFYEGKNERAYQVDRA